MIRQSTRKNFLKIIAPQLLLLGLLTVALPFAHAAADLSPISAGGPNGLPHVTADQSNVSTILKIVFGIIGAFALLNITLSGLKYITSAGNPQKTSEAKSGIVYSVVGLVIAISAEAIVAFVVHRT
jgi:hypothetical protein